jgi:hypothetical protein
MGVSGNPAVRAVFDSYDPILRQQLLSLRQMILDVAASIPGVGALEETLKWGQPSFLTSLSKSGTTLRIDRLSKSDHRPALFVSCQTDLIERFKALYPDSFFYHGKRAIVLDTDRLLDEDALRHCIALALTYKIRRAGKMPQKALSTTAEDAG